MKTTVTHIAHLSKQRKLKNRTAHVVGATLGKWAHPQLHKRRGQATAKSPSDLRIHPLSRSSEPPAPLTTLYGLQGAPLPGFYSRLGSPQGSTELLVVKEVEQQRCPHRFCAVKRRGRGPGGGVWGLVRRVLLGSHTAGVQAGLPLSTRPSFFEPWGPVCEVQ